MREIVIEHNDSGQRLDRFLRKYLPKAPLSLVYKLVRKDVKVNGKRAKEDTFLNEGDVLTLYMPDEDIEGYVEKKRPRSAKRQFKVLLENDDLIIVSKPFGLLVHGDKTEKKDTLANQVTDYLIETGAYVPRLEKTFVPSPVHRLDRNTTGLVVFGKNAQALRVLSAMMREAPADEKDVKESICLRKYYITVLCGELDRSLTLKNRLVKDEKKNRGIVKPLSYDGGKYIETVARPLYTGGGYTLAEIELVTGRSHQIRAHMSWAGFPLLGDTKYGGRAYMLPGASQSVTTQLLHAARIEFTGAPEPLDYLNGTSVTCPLPPGWQTVERELFGKYIAL
ncbi:MAG: RluA family pseudouridine synthase [Firmicutes bacterium]|nr:RluA family pseudouridine synthase [Bacillota bacterium]MBQ4181519.1 RluA family pseudouridine synthase [Bacillota bacterium]